MSFKCGECGKTVPKGVSPTMKVVETRTRSKDGGSEIVREIALCPECAKK